MWLLNLLSERQEFSPLSIAVLADRLQVVHGLPLIEADAIRLDVLVVMLGPLQPIAWDHSFLDCPLTAAMQNLQH